MSNLAPINRRHMLQTSSLGFGCLALHHLLGTDHAGLHAAESKAGGAVDTHFTPRVKSVIMMMQNGGPSQMELFDPKPELDKRDGQVFEQQVEQFQTGSEANKLMGSVFKFAPRGESGLQMSDTIPHLHTVADELCMIRSMQSGHNNHTEALVHFNTGKIFPGRPSLGSWACYALGTENQDLPAYVVLRDHRAYNTSGTLLWQSAWLPQSLAGTEISTVGTPILNLTSEREISKTTQARNLDALSKLNRLHKKRFPKANELDARIANYELAARMQVAAPELLDLSKETAEVKAMYGVDSEDQEKSMYSTRCLMARRMVESGVRFVQVFPPASPNSQPWDTHGDTKNALGKICEITDQGSAALIKDLKQRGLLDSTLIIWSGEFGRLPISQNGTGRDHNRNAFTLLLAGGGVKGGFAYGNTDEFGYKSVENVVTVPDLHATVLHQMGINHEQLIVNHNGSEETPTDARVTDAKVVFDVLEHPAG